MIMGIEPNRQANHGKNNEIAAAPLLPKNESAPAEAVEVSVQAVPWALPGEDTPILLQWDAVSPLERVELELPLGFRVEKALNVADLTSNGQMVVANEFESPGYAVVYVKNTEIPSEVLTRSTVSVIFRGCDGKETKRQCFLTIVRPKLESVSAQSEVVIDDKTESTMSERSPIEVALRHTGLGMVSIEMKAKIRNRIISQSQDVIRNLIQKMIELMPSEETESLTKPDGALQDAARKAGVEVEVDRLADEAVTAIHDQLMAFLSSGQLPDDVAPREVIDELKEAFATMDMTAFNNMVTGQITNMYTRYVLERIRRYPSDFSELEGGPSGIRIDPTVNEFRLTVKYTDSVRNEYPPIEATLSVRDMRTKKTPLTVPIAVKIETQLLTGLTRDASW